MAGVRLLPTDAMRRDVQEGPDHVGVLVATRPGVVGNTMMQHDPDGRPLFMHANLGKMDTNVPARADRYFRRWKWSLVHGANVTEVIREASGGVDLEMWLYELIRDNHCLFDSHNSWQWQERLGLGPIEHGIALLEYPNLNKDLACFKVIEEAGSVIHNTTMDLV